MIDFQLRKTGIGITSRMEGILNDAFNKNLPEDLHSYIQSMPIWVIDAQLLEKTVSKVQTDSISQGVVLDLTTPAIYIVTFENPNHGRILFSFESSLEKTNIDNGEENAQLFFCVDATGAQYPYRCHMFQAKEVDDKIYLQTFSNYSGVDFDELDTENMAYALSNYCIMNYEMLRMPKLSGLRKKMMKKTHHRPRNGIEKYKKSQKKFKVVSLSKEKSQNHNTHTGLIMPAHNRRGYYRTYKSGTTGWVNSCKIHGGVDTPDLYKVIA